MCVLGWENSICGRGLNFVLQRFSQKKISVEALGLGGCSTAVVWPCALTGPAGCHDDQPVVLVSALSDDAPLGVTARHQVTRQVARAAFAQVFVQAALHAERTLGGSWGERRHGPNGHWEGDGDRGVTGEGVCSCTYVCGRRVKEAANLLFCILYNIWWWQ